jgi:hypothetical protein
MAAETDAAAATDVVPCPDPTAHDHRNKLSEQAGAAALYATRPDSGTATPSKSQEKSRDSIFGSDGKLSSKSKQHTAMDPGTHHACAPDALCSLRIPVAN